MDSERLLRELQAAGWHFDSLERTPGGETGAYFCQDDQGRQWVLKPMPVAQVVDARKRVEVIEHLREKGHRIPPHVMPIELSDCAVQLQQVVEGSASTRVTMSFVDELFDLAELQAGEGQRKQWRRGTWSEFLMWTLLEGAETYCRHDALQTHSQRGRDVVEWARSIGKASRNLMLPSDDIVHYDLHALNVLRTSNGDIAAVIDWEGCRPGNRVFDLVTFTYDLAPYDVEEGLEVKLRERIRDRCEPDELRMYAAHMVLRMSDWAVRHYDEPTIERWLDHADDWRAWL